LNTLADRGDMCVYTHQMSIEKWVMNGQIYKIRLAQEDPYRL
jgi:hypothetical protein